MERECINHISTFLQGRLALILVCVALLSCFVMSVYDYDLQDVGGSGGLAFILRVVTYVPEWLGNFCYYTSVLLFNVALYNGLKHLMLLSSLLRVNIVVSIFMLLFGVISCGVNEDSDTALLLGLIILVLFIVYLVVQIRIGLLMMKNFEGHIVAVGKWMIISVITSLVLSTLGMFVTFIVVVALIANMYIFYMYCDKLYIFLK